MKTVITDQQQAIPSKDSRWLPLLSLVLLVMLAAVGKVWSLSDVWSAVRGVTLLWFPTWFFLCVVLRRECIDEIEIAFLSAVGCVAFVSGLALLSDAAAIWWPAARHAKWLVPIALMMAAVVILKRRGANGSETLVGFRHYRPDWMLVALVLASLCATARYQRPFEAVGDSGDVRYLLNGDQTYFTSLAYELDRGCPPADCPYHAGVRERAYHSLPHLTLALFGQASGETDLLRSHLVVGYSVLVALCCGLVFCLSRELGGSRSAGLTGTWLLFVGAIPIPPLSPNLVHYFYFTIWPQSSSTIEPTLLTSPQMFYGVTVVYGVLLGLLRVFRSLRDGRPYLRLAIVTSLLAALLLRFRVQCFVVVFPCVCLAFLVMAIRHRCYWLLGVLVPAVSVAVFQVVEMKLPTYLPTSQKLRIGNNLVGFSVGFLHDWPGGETAYYLIDYLTDDPVWFDWFWQFATLPMFVALNMLGIPMLVALAVYAQSAWRNPQERSILYSLGVLTAVAIIAAATLAVDYDGYSVGGQILLHFGWFTLPCVAVGVWRMLVPVLQRAHLTSGGLTGLFCFVTLAAVTWQMVRGPSSCEQQGCSHSTVITVGERAAWDYCRRELPFDAVLLTNRLEINVAKWSGLAGRRTYLDYPNRVLDPLLPKEDSMDSRQQLIDRLYLTRDDDEFQQLLSKTTVTHVVEFQDSPLHAKPASVVRPVWHSPDHSVTIWKVDRGVLASSGG